MAVATLLLASALWDIARGVAILGLLAAACDVVAGYPDHVGPKITVACGAVFAAWFAAVGFWLLRRRSEGAQ
jgi:uncharacterized membrane protein YeiB